MAPLVLVYVAKKNCPACTKFDNNWRQLVNVLGHSMRLVKFECTPDRPAPPCLEPFVEYYPTLLLAPASSYHRYFTDDDDTLGTRGTVKGIKMSLDSVPSFRQVRDWVDDHEKSTA